MLLFSVIKKEEIISKNYLKKLNSFNKMCDLYGVLYNSSEVLQKDYYQKVGQESLDLSKNKPLLETMNKKSYPIFIKLEKMFSRITLLGKKEVIYVNRYVMFFGTSVHCRMGTLYRNFWLRYLTYVVQDIYPEMT